MLYFLNRGLKELSINVEKTPQMASQNSVNRFNLMFEWTTLLQHFLDSHLFLSEIQYTLLNTQAIIINVILVRALRKLIVNFIQFNL